MAVGSSDSWVAQIFVSVHSRHKTAQNICSGTLKNKEISHSLIPLRFMHRKIYYENISNM